MVGVVVVSHSDKIAQGVVELAEQMVRGKVKILPAGGTADGEIGTDATKILEAIQNAQQGDGVLVLVDLGSALLSAEMALEFLEEEERENVKIADAPIVEGAVVAAVEAFLGKTLEEVKQACEASKGIAKFS